MTKVGKLEAEAATGAASNRSLVSAARGAGRAQKRVTGVRRVGARLVAHGAESRDTDAGGDKKSNGVFDHSCSGFVFDEASDKFRNHTKFPSLGFPSKWRIGAMIGPLGSRI